MSKRPNSTDTSSPSKRNRTHQSEWGLPQVLAECGCLLHPAARGDEDDDDTTDLGCQLEPRVAPTTLCSSINALLNEMASGVDPNNKRVLDSLEETLGGSLDTEEVDINGDNKCNGGKTSILLRRMLLPLYRIRSEMMQSQMSQMSQSPSRDISGIKTESYSLIQVLLRIDMLQPRLLSSLIQLLPEIASRFQSEDSSLTEDIPKLIFANIRWLDHIIDSASLTAAFSECLTILASSSADCPKTKGILLDAIATLPDILNDYNTFGGDDGDSVLATLQLLRVEDPTLLIPCLDAIDSLPLGEIEVEKVMNDALEALANVEAWGLPALTTFLINNCPRGGGMAKQVIEEFRKLPLGGGDDDDYLRDDAQSASDTEALMIEALSRGFAHRSDLTSTLLKSIKETAQGYHKPADIWLLACCASATHNRAQVKTVFRLKANDGGFTSQMVRQSLEGNGVALTSLFGTSLCDLADSLLRSTDGETCELGVTLYDVLFSEFKEPMQRQEVVGSLATHVGAGVGSRQSEVDAAMRAFSSIISQNQSKDKESGVCALRPFTPFLTSLLDHLPNMSTFQVRKLFVLLFTVGAEGEEGTGGGLCGEAGILIKKYIGLNDFTKKQIGIIGAISYAVSASSYFLEQQRASNDAAGTTAAAACPPNAFREIKELIEFALLNCKPPKSGERIQTVTSLGSSFADSRAGAFLLQELSHAVRSGKLLPSIREWLDEHFQAEFESTYIADFVVENTQEEKVGKGSKGTGTKLGLIPTSPSDLALLNRTSSNALAPPGEVRFALNGPMAEIYIKILPLLSSPSVNAREVLSAQLCPMFSLMATLNDTRYAGQGLGELDAVLECPMILPSSDCSGIEFADLSPSQQWVTTASYYFATCWVRELINAFIHAETFTPSSLDNSTIASRSASSQGFQVDIKVRLIERLKNLLELEEDLRFTSSKCYTFAPPGLDVLAPPKELFEDNVGDEHNNSDVFRDIDPNDMSESAVKKASKNAKKLATKLAKQNEKSKAKRLAVKSKYEKLLADRALGQLRPLDPAVCVALGFKQLSPLSDVEEGSQLSVGFSQIHAPKIAGPTHLMLFNVLDGTLSQLLSNKQVVPFKSGIGATSKNKEGINDNPYGVDKGIASDNNFSDVLLATCDASQKECFNTLRLLLEGNVFSSLFEHLATLAQYRCDSDIPDEDSEKHVLVVASSLFSCITTILGSNKLTRSSAGRSFLAGIVKAISTGCVDKAPPKAPVIDVVKWLSSLFDLVKDIVTGSYTDDIEFVMNGINCMSAILDCSRRLANNSPDSGDGSSSNEIDAIRDKLADVTNSLLRRGWSEETKLNRNNVGKMVSLLLESSHTEIPSSVNAAVKVDEGNLGRISILRLLVNDVLNELPNTEKCKGPVDLFQTCSSQTFSCYYSVVLSFLQKELASLFDSCLGKTKDPSAAKKTLEVVTELVSMIQTLFDLTRKNEALAKKHPLLQQLKWGSRFIETFVSKAIPFFHTHFQQHQDSILMIITDLQKSSRQLYHIISHGKRAKDANLAKETPRSKKALELFIHKVKALLKKNRCLTAMWTKTLKSKDIDGTVLKDDKESVHGEEGDSDSDDEEEEEEDGDNSSAGEYETDDASVDE